MPWGEVGQDWRALSDPLRVWVSEPKHGIAPRSLRSNIREMKQKAIAPSFWQSATRLVPYALLVAVVASAFGYYRGSGSGGSAIADLVGRALVLASLLYGGDRIVRWYRARPKRAKTPSYPGRHRSVPIPSAPPSASQRVSGFSLPGTTTSGLAPGAQNRRRPASEEVIDGVELLFGVSYESAIEYVRNPQYGSSKEDVEAMAEEYVYWLKAGKPVPSDVVQLGHAKFPRRGQYFDFIAGRPRYLLEEP